jgi:hypothetical protein
MELSRIHVLEGSFVDVDTMTVLDRWHSAVLGWTCSIVRAGADEVTFLAGGRRWTVPTGGFLRNWKPVEDA